MKFFEKLVRLATKKIYIFMFLIFFTIILIFSVTIIFDLKNLNPFLYFEF